MLENVLSLFKFLAFFTPLKSEWGHAKAQSVLGTLRALCHLQKRFCDRRPNQAQFLFFLLVSGRTQAGWDVLPVNDSVTWNLLFDVR